MCAEAVPWRCHRSLIGDAVLARGGVVEDIFVTPEGRSSRKPHEMTEFARVEGWEGLVSGCPASGCSRGDAVRLSGGLWAVGISEATVPLVRDTAPCANDTSTHLINSNRVITVVSRWFAQAGEYTRSIKGELS